MDCSTNGPRGQRPCIGNRQRNVLAAAASGVARFIDHQGGDAARVFTRAGLREEQLNDPFLSVDLGDYCRMMELAAADTGHDNFGLWFGQQFQPQDLGLIGHIALASPTLGMAVDNLARMFPLHQQATETRLAVEGEFLRLEYRILDGQIVQRRQDAELTMGMFANVFRACLGSGWAPEEVHFEHLRPETRQEHEQAFDAPVYFGQRTNCLMFRNSNLDRRMPAGDLPRLMELRAQLLRLAGGIGKLPFLDRVGAEIRTRLPEGYPHVEEIGDALGVARWTLQRRLAEQGIAFSDLVDEVRRQAAAHYIDQRYLPLAEIASALGYSEPSAFSRAFRRWFGVSPLQYRRTEPGDRQHILGLSAALSV